MEKAKILDIPDYQGCFCIGLEGFQSPPPNVDIRAISKWMRENDIRLEPGERLDPEIVKKYIINEP